MKKLISILLILSLASCKKEEFNPNQVKEFSIQSVSNGANYNIKVALPENYNPESTKYAAVYVMDGEENFNFVAEKSKSISSDYSRQNILVVSIGYGNNREYDYTPTQVSGSGGGAEQFMLFIKNELIPVLENEFGADTSRSGRIILGHSYGGLLAAYAFTNFNEVFGNYIMLSPSLWYDDEILFKYEQDHRNINKENKQLVFMGLGQMENEGRMLAPFIGFYNRLQNNYPQIKIQKHLEPGLDHGGSKKPNIIEGLKFYFQNK